MMMQRPSACGLGVSYNESVPEQSEIVVFCTRAQAHRVEDAAVRRACLTAFVTAGLRGSGPRGVQGPS